MAKLHSHLFEPGRGVVEELRRQIGELVEGDAAIPLFEGWMYWPATAGGLGLSNPLLVLSSFQTDPNVKVEPVPIPQERSDSWLILDNGWAELYREYLREGESSPPRETVVMETLVKDFIARGSEVSNRTQSSLSTYWKWILSTYGPQIIERLGTFRFLQTDLVPLSLILNNRRDNFF